MATASAGALGIWLAVGGMAIALGLMCFVLNWDTACEVMRPTVKHIAEGFGAGALMVVATYILYPVVIHLAPFLAPDIAHLYAEFYVPSKTTISVALAPVILGEEWVWRYVVQAALVQRFGTWVGIVLGACVYALAHVPLGSPALVLAALLCGLFWGALRQVTGSLIPAVIAHLLWDGAVLLCWPL